jgi:hypothetical protein
MFEEQCQEANEAEAEQEQWNRSTDQHHHQANNSNNNHHHPHNKSNTTKAKDKFESAKIGNLHHAPKRAELWLG